MLNRRPAPIAYHTIQNLTQEAETHTERLARIRAQLGADDGRAHGSIDDVEDEAAAGQDAADAHADDTDAEEQPASRQQAGADSSKRAHGQDAAAAQGQHGSQKLVRGKKKGKRKRDPERKRPDKPGERQRAELKQQLLAKGLPEGGREGPADGGKGRQHRTDSKRGGKVADRQQMPTKMSVVKLLLSNAQVKQCAPTCAHRLFNTCVDAACTDVHSSAA